MDLDSVREVLERARSLDEARDYPALYSLLRTVPEDHLFAEPELAFLLADVSRRVGSGDAALALIDGLKPVAGRRGNDRLGRKRSNLEGILHFDRGHYVEAEAAWLRLLADADQAEDDEFVARANNNLGILCTLSGRLEEALAHYGRAVNAYRNLGYRRGLAQSNQNLAITYRELGFFIEAERHFLDAVQFAREDGSMDELARAEQERALLQLIAGDPSLAAATANAARQRYERLNDPAGIAEVERVLGLIALQKGEYGSARMHLVAARDWAAANHSALLDAECQEALAAVADALDGDGAGNSLREEAERRFAALGAGPWGERVRARVREFTNPLESRSPSRA